jgi:hypothetical protein
MKWCFCSIHTGAGTPPTGISPTSYMCMYMCIDVYDRLLFWSREQRGGDAHAGGAAGRRGALKLEREMDMEPTAVEIERWRRESERAHGRVGSADRRLDGLWYSGGWPRLMRLRGKLGRALA